MRTWLLACLLLLTRSAAAESISPRWVVHLLDYIALDYSMAVEDGKIVSQDEYGEMLEFADKVIEGTRALDPSLVEPATLETLANLRTLVQGKAPVEEVARMARQAQSAILRSSKLEVSPKTWPDLKEGARLYARNCAFCHGPDGRGNGPSAAGLEPAPTDFHGDKMPDVAPFQAFNAIRLGVPGTAMAAFDALSDGEAWALAFYVVSLRYGEPRVARGEPAVPLELAASRPDRELSARLSPGELAALRTRSEEGGGGAGFLRIARGHLEGALEAVRRGDFETANREAIAAYLDGVEPVEPTLRAKDAAFVARLESAMFAVRQTIGEKATAETVASRVASARGVLAEAEELLGRSQVSPGFTFSVAAGIFLREGFEAILIIVTLLGVIRAIGSRRAAFYVHGGWLLAVVVGVVGWFFSGWVVGMSGVSREVMEGTIALLAVVVLLYFGFWLHRRVQIQRWRIFLESLARTAVEGRRLAALGVVSFMAVFREAFETILFLRALSLEPGVSHGAMWAGVGVSFAVILALAVALVRFSVRIPVRQLFSISSVVVWLLAFVLTGKAVHAFQESGWLTVTGTPWTWALDWVGFFPTYETVLAQVLVLLTGVVLYWIGNRPPRAEVAVSSEPGATSPGR